MSTFFRITPSSNSRESSYLTSFERLLPEQFSSLSGDTEKGAMSTFFRCIYLQEKEACELTFLGLSAVCLCVVLTTEGSLSRLTSSLDSRILLLVVNSYLLELRQTGSGRDEVTTDNVLLHAFEVICLHREPPTIQTKTKQKGEVRCFSFLLNSPCGDAISLRSTPGCRGSRGNRGGRCWCT